MPLLDRFIATPKFQIFSIKSAIMVKIFRGSDLRLYYKKAVLKGFKNFTEKTYAWASF